MIEGREGENLDNFFLHERHECPLCDCQVGAHGLRNVDHQNAHFHCSRHSVDVCANFGFWAGPNASLERQQLSQSGSGQLRVVPARLQRRGAHLNTWYSLPSPNPLRRYKRDIILTHTNSRSSTSEVKK